MASDYEKNIAAGLSKAYEQPSARVDFNVETDKWVIFSDLHRGKRDGADDFKCCEKAYNAALGYYLEKGYTLIGLGDVDELWECSPKDVIKAYDNTMKLERDFQVSGRYHRFFGNHDSDWKRANAVARYLHKIYDDRLTVHESMIVTVQAAGIKLGEVFLVHGHQGTLESDQYGFISRIAVRYGWGFIQRTFNIRSTTPSKDFALRDKHNVAMYRWADARKETVLIAGHTHRPVFASRNKLADLQEELRVLREQIANAGPNPPSDLLDKVARKRAEIESNRVQEFSSPSGELPVNQARPCYFNTGCCSFSDGDVTGLEIADGAIRLVRWLDDDDRCLPKVLATRDLRAVFNATAQVSQPSPVAAGGGV
jgi:predicted phosphodiesterase